MTLRNWGDEALPARRPAIEPHQIGLRPSFINEDKMFRLQMRLHCAPLFARLGDIGAILFGGAQ